MAQTLSNNVRCPYVWVCGGVVIYSNSFMGLMFLLKCCCMLRFSSTYSGSTCIKYKDAFKAKGFNHQMLLLLLFSVVDTLAGN